MSYDNGYRAAIRWREEGGQRPDSPDDHKWRTGFDHALFDIEHGHIDITQKKVNQ